MKGIGFVVNDKNERIAVQIDLDCWCRFAKTPTMAIEKVPLLKVIRNLEKLGK